MLSRYRIAVVALFAALSLGTFVGCDSEEEDALGGITGDWERLEEGQGIEYYLRITENRLALSLESSFGDVCSSVEIVEYNADTGVLTIEDPDDPGETNEVTVRRDGDDLLFDGDRFEQSDAFPSDCS
jgi:hypothetical protein